MFGIDAWFGNLSLLIKYMLEDGLQPYALSAATVSQTAVNGDNGQKLERDVHRFEDEGGPPSPPQPLKE